MERNTSHWGKTLLGCFLSYSRMNYFRSCYSQVIFHWVGAAIFMSKPSDLKSELCYWRSLKVTFNFRSVMYMKILSTMAELKTWRSSASRRDWWPCYIKSEVSIISKKRSLVIFLIWQEKCYTYSQVFILKYSLLDIAVIITIGWNNK